MNANQPSLFRKLFARAHWRRQSITPIGNGLRDARGLQINRSLVIWLLYGVTSPADVAQSRLGRLLSRLQVTENPHFCIGFVRAQVPICLGFARTQVPQVAR